MTDLGLAQTSITMKKPKAMKMAVALTRAVRASGPLWAESYVKALMLDPWERRFDLIYR